MKLRGTRGGISLLLEPNDTLIGIERELGDKGQLLNGKVRLELSEQSTPWNLLAGVAALIKEHGGRVSSLEALPSKAKVVPALTPLPRYQPREKGKTVIIARGVRSGGRVDSKGSIVVLGDVNAGAELVAVDDVIVVGTLRGLAHAGKDGSNGSAVVWAQKISAPQLRIGDAVKQFDSESSEGTQAEIAFLEEGAIVVRQFD